MDEFFKEWKDLQEKDEKVLETLRTKDPKTWTKDENDVYNKYKKWSELSSQYASNMNQLVTDLGSNMATTAEAQMKAMGAMFQFYVSGSENAAWDQYGKFLKDGKGLKALYKKLEDENKGVESDKETTDNFNELLQNILSKLGADEITTLAVEQRRLKDEITKTSTEYNNMLKAGEKVTEEMWRGLDKLNDKYKDTQQQIKYLNEDQIRANKLLEEQANLDKRISQNTNALNTAKERLEIEKERNGYSDKYFDILKKTERLEEEGYRLQEEALDNKKRAIDDEFAVYQDRINTSEELTDNEKKQAIEVRAKTVELEKQAIDNQKITVAYERQLSALIKQKALISEMKQLEESNLRLTIQMNESSTRAYASNVRNLDDMSALYNNQNDQMARLS